MNDSPISQDIALRIALASRALPDTDAARLLKVLADAVGLPPTAANLSKMTIKTFKQAADGELADIETPTLKAALEILQGGEEALAEADLPPLDNYKEGDVPDAIRVACASNTSEVLDGHFGSCSRFLIYQLNRDEVRLIDIRSATGPESRDDKNAYRAELIKDCQVLFVASIGGPAAAKVVKAGVHPIKHQTGGSCRERLADLQQVIRTSPPPWLAKVMGHAAEERVRFEWPEAEAATDD